MAIYGKRQSLEEWVDEAMTDGEKPGACSEIKLMHMVGSGQNELHTIRFSGARKWTPKELAEAFDARARFFGQDLPGAQTYCLLAFYEGCQEPLARHPFVVTAVQADFNGLTTEAPTEKGMIQQGMRHLEVQQAEANRMVRFAAESLASINEGLMKRINEQEHEIIDANRNLRQMVLGEITEKHKFRMEEAKEERNNALLEKFAEFAPLLLNTITGREIIPQSKADTILIDTLAKSATPETVAILMKTLPAESQGLFMARMQELAEARQRAEESAAKALTAGMSGEDDAAGGSEL
jgi:hypothetical protein